MRYLTNKIHKPLKIYYKYTDMFLCWLSILLIIHPNLLLNAIWKLEGWNELNNITLHKNWLLLLESNWLCIIVIAFSSNTMVSMNISIIQSVLWWCQVFWVFCRSSQVFTLNTSLAAPGALAHRLQHLTARLIQNGRQGLEKG